MIARGLLLLSLCSGVGVSPATQDRASCVPIESRFTDHRRPLSPEERGRFDFVARDFVQNGPETYRNHMLIPWYMYHDPSTGDTGVMFMIEGVRDHEIFSVINRTGKILMHRTHSSMANCIF